MTRPLPRAPYGGQQDTGYQDGGAYPHGAHSDGSADDAGYYEDPYGPPPYEGYAPNPPWYARPKMLMAIAAGVVIAIGGFYAAYAFTQTALGGVSTASQPKLPAPQASAPAAAEPSPADEPSPEPSTEPSPEPSAAQSPQAVAPFQDDQLRQFAGRVAGNDGCTGTASTLQNVTEIVTCTLNGGATVRYLRFADDQARDDYRASVRNGLDGRLDIRRDSQWSARGRRQGTFVSGDQNGGSAYVYWDLNDAPVSGEVVIANENANGAERFWRREL